MLSKVLLFGLVGLLLMKLLTKLSWRVRLRELGRKLDRAVNATLIAIIVVYCAQLVYMWVR